MGELLAGFDTVVLYLPQILLFFCTGYLFIWMFSLTSFVSKEDISEHIMAKSVSVSFVFVVIYKYLAIFPKFADAGIRLMIVLLLSIVSGLLIGKARQIKWIGSIIDWFVPGNLNTDLRLDIFDEARGGKIMYIRYKLQNDDMVYQGQIRRIMGNPEDPVFMLHKTEMGKYKQDGQFIQIKEYSDKSKVLCRFSEMREVEILYYDS